MGPVDALTEWRARRWLVTLGDRLGSDGLLVAAVVPGLAAVVDQHAAAVRDILAATHTGPVTDRVLLAGYGRGLLERCGASVRQVQRQTLGRWTQADWLALRLLGVCALSRSLPARPCPAVRRSATSH